MAPIRFQLRWTDALQAEGLRCRAVRDQRAGAMLSFRVRLAWTLGIVAPVLIGWTVAIQLFGFSLDDALMFGLGVVTGMLLLRLTWRFYRRREAALRERLDLRLSEGADILLDMDGLSIALSDRRSRLAWSGLDAVEPFEQAVWLTFSGGVGLPVPDLTLPDGVDRAELLRRLAAWRQAEPFA